MTATTPLQATQDWLEKAVIGLNLCPFAKAVHTKGQIRWVLSSADQPLALLKELVQELKLLAASPAEEAALLMEQAPIGLPGMAQGLPS